MRLDSYRCYLKCSDLFLPAQIYTSGGLSSQLLQYLTNSTCINIRVYSFSACSTKPLRYARCFPVSCSPHCSSMCLFYSCLISNFLSNLDVCFAAWLLHPTSFVSESKLASLILFQLFSSFYLFLSLHLFLSSAFPGGEKDVVSHLADFTADWQSVAVLLWLPAG